jgi:hypothetical protein
MLGSIILTTPYHTDNSEVCLVSQCDVFAYLKFPADTKHSVTLTHNVCSNTPRKMLVIVECDAA